MHPSAIADPRAYTHQQPLTLGNPPPAMHFLASNPGSTQPSSRLQSMGPTPFSTPPMPRKALHFASSPQSEDQRRNSAAFGHSPGPSPSWERTPHSQESWQPPVAPASGTHGLQEVDTATSKAPTTAYHPLQLPAAHRAQQPQVGAIGMEGASAPPKEAVKHVMTSTRKRAAVGSLSPQMRPLGSQGHSVSVPARDAAEDSVWEARIQEAVRKAVLSMAPQVMSASQFSQAQINLPPNPLSAAALAEAEAAHIEQGRRLQEAIHAQEKWAAEVARKAEEQARERACEAARQAAEQSRREAEEAQAIQAQLQQQLQALAAADVEVAHAFAVKREALARESQTIAMRLQLL